MKYNTLHYTTIQYNTRQSNPIQSNTIQYNTIHTYIHYLNTDIQYMHTIHTIQYNTTQYAWQLLEPQRPHIIDCETCWNMYVSTCNKLYGMNADVSHSSLIVWAFRSGHHLAFKVKLPTRLYSRCMASWSLHHSTMRSCSSLIAWACRPA